MVWSWRSIRRLVPTVRLAGKPNQPISAPKTQNLASRPLQHGVNSNVCQLDYALAVPSIDCCRHSSQTASQRYNSKCLYQNEAGSIPAGASQPPGPGNVGTPLFLLDALSHSSDILCAGSDRRPDGWKLAIGGPHEQLAGQNSSAAIAPAGRCHQRRHLFGALYHQPGTRPARGPCRPKGPRYLACRSNLSELGPHRDSAWFPSRGSRSSGSWLCCATASVCSKIASSPRYSWAADCCSSPCCSPLLPFPEDCWKPLRPRAASPPTTKRMPSVGRWPTRL